MLFVIGLLFFVAAVLAMLRAVGFSRIRAGAHLRGIEAYGFTAGLDTEGTSQEPLNSSLKALAQRVGTYAAARVSVLKPLPGRDLVSAGLYTLAPEVFHGYRVLTSVTLGTVVLLLAALTGGAGALTILLGVLGVSGTWVFFGAYVRRRGEGRLNEIDRELPELIDVLTATIEAGLGFAGSLQLVAERFKGPLGTELRLTLQEQSMGLSTSQALSKMLVRCDSPAMRSFVRAVAQGESLGVSIGTMMRNLAVEMRKRRRQSAHESVQKAPVKMLFPLIFLIFPPLLIVLLYPAVHAIGQAFAGG
jgi:tight adherence protein C